jgi:hypothetical protein
MWWPQLGDCAGSRGALRLLFDWVAKNGRQHTGMIPVSVAQPVPEPVYRYGCSAGMRTLSASADFQSIRNATLGVLLGQRGVPNEIRDIQLVGTWKRTWLMILLVLIISS